MMRKLFIIFAVTTGYTKAIATAVASLFVVAVMVVSFWLYLDWAEISLYNRIQAQKEIVEITRSNPEVALQEQRKLIELKCEYNILTESWFGRMVIKSRLATKNRTH